MTKISSFKKKNIYIFLILLLACSFYKIQQSAYVAGNQNKITIYHTNDMHGALNSCYTPEGKLIQIGADVLKTLKSSTPNSLLIDAGDSTQGSSLALLNQGSNIIELMNLAGYDFATLGNHEFDQGVDVLKLNSALAKFKILSANVYNENSFPILESETNNGCNTVIEINGKSLGLFGLTTSATKYTTHPKNIENITFKNEIETAKQQCQYLKQKKVDIIICIAHIGSTDSEVSSEAIAKEVPDIDIIIDGHSHEVYSKTVGHTFIQQVGSKSKNVGKIEIAFNENKKFDISHSIIKASDLINPLEANTNQYMPDSKISKICRDMLQKVSESFKIIIGKTDSSLYGGEYKKTRICRLTDTNLGNLVGDSLVHHGKEVISKSGITKNIHIVSLQNGGGIRALIPPKFISVGDATNVFPFPNKVSIKLLSPSQLYEILENGFKSIHIKDGVLVGPDGAFPNVGGMRIEFDINGQPLEFNENKNVIVSAGSRIKKIVLINEDGSDNKYLDKNDRETQIALVTNSFETSGGDQYVSLKDLPSLTDEDTYIRDVLCDYIKFLTFKNGGSFNYPVRLSRVKLINSEKLFDNNYSIVISVKENSANLKNKEVSIEIDNEKPFYKTTDENGNITLNNLECGPHDIKVRKCDTQMSAYVNNMVGITTADIFLENTKEQDINDVVYIIDGIQHQKISDISDYLVFARNAYESLPEESKALVTNYNNLINAEKANKALNTHDTNAFQTPRDSLNSFYAAIISILLISTTYFVIRKLRKASNKI